MRPNWPKLDSLAQKTWTLKLFSFLMYVCVHCFQESFLLEFIYSFKFPGKLKFIQNGPSPRADSSV